LERVLEKVVACRGPPLEAIDALSSRHLDHPLKPRLGNWAGHFFVLLLTRQAKVEVVCGNFGTKTDSTATGQLKNWWR